jgi:hypothetical protein
MAGEALTPSPECLVVPLVQELGVRGGRLLQHLVFLFAMILAAFFWWEIAD